MPELFHLVSRLFDQRGKCQCGSPPAGVPRVGPGLVPGGVGVDERVVLGVGVALEEAAGLGVVPAGAQVVELHGRSEVGSRQPNRLADS
jgi:hypothetical protein